MKDFSVKFSSFIPDTDVKWFVDTFWIFYDWLDENPSKLERQIAVFALFMRRGTLENGFFKQLRQNRFHLSRLAPILVNFRVLIYFIGAGGFQNFDYVK